MDVATDSVKNCGKPETFNSAAGCVHYDVLASLSQPTVTGQLGVKLDFLEPGNYGCIKQEKILLERPRKYGTYYDTIQAEHKKSCIRETPSVHVRIVAPIL